MADPEDKNSPPSPVDDQKTDNLDQSQIDQLVEETKQELESDFIIYKCSGEKVSSEEGVVIDIYDFRNPVFLTEAELRLIRLRQANFIEYLSSRLSMALRLDLSIKLSKLHTSPYEKFTHGITNPAYISLFKINQLTGVGLVAMRPRLAMALVNRLLGGKPKIGEEDKALTEIETALMDDVIPLILDEWCQQWKDIKELDASILGNESNGRFLQTSPHDAIMLILDVEVAIGENSETIQLAVPYYMIEPLIKAMLAENKKYSAVNTLEKKPQWIPSYSDIDIPIKAEWDACQIAVRDLLCLQPGDVIELPSNIMQQTHLRLKNKIRFNGEIGLNKDRVAVKINEKVKSED